VAGIASGLNQPNGVAIGNGAPGAALQMVDGAVLISDDTRNPTQRRPFYTTFSARQFQES